jgi:nucleoside-diphosphate-sugar epimerase
LRDLGRVERTYCYIADGLEMMLNAALHGAQDVYNIAGAQHIQVVDFAAAVGRAAGVKVIVPRGAPDSAPANLRVDCARYVAEFGTPEWTPLDDGIKETLEWWKNG